MNGPNVNIQIPVYTPYLRGREAEYVQDCLSSGWISSRGQYVPRFEREFAAYIGVNHATTVSNGTVALHLALLALGIGPGDEVIVPAFTYIASVNAIAYVGATPVFVDSIEETWNLNPAQLAGAITARTKAVLAVHLYGAPCELDEISRICKAHKLYLIEDAAEAFGSKFKGRFVGTYGDVSTFSFFGNKTITTGEGGMVVSNDPQLIEHAALLKSQAVSPTREYWHDEIGFNYRMTNTCAAIGVAQLEQADQIIARKREIAEWYRTELHDAPFVFQPDSPDSFNSFWMVSLVAKDLAARDGVRAYLKLRGVETRPFFYPAHRMPAFRSSASFPVAESLSERGLNLPSSPELTKETVQFISSHIHRFLDDLR